MYTRCIVKTRGFTRGVCKNRGFIKFKGFLVEFVENRRSSEKSKTPRKSPDKWTFLSLAFCDAPSLDTAVVTRKCSSTDPETPKNSKTQKSDSKVTFGAPAKVTQKLIKSDSKVTKTVQKSHFLVTFESLLSNFWVTLAGAPKVTFLSLFCVFEFFGVSGSVGLLLGHNTKGQTSSTPSWAAYA